MASTCGPWGRVACSMGLVVPGRTSGGYWVGPRELEASRPGLGVKPGIIFMSLAIAHGLGGHAICFALHLSPGSPWRVTRGRSRRSGEHLWAGVDLLHSSGHTGQACVGSLPSKGGSGQPVTTGDQEPQSHTGPGTAYCSNESHVLGPCVTCCPTFSGTDPILGTWSSGPQKTSPEGQSGTNGLQLF